MREILFRGKHIHKLLQNGHLDGIWVYGYLCDRNYIYSPELEGEILVDSETICQYTGLIDRNGRKIFEGDIVKATILLYQRTQYAIGYIVFERGTFKVYITKSVHEKVYTEYAEEDVKTYSIENNFLNRGYVLEVIGNIFDSQEILKNQLRINF